LPACDFIEILEKISRLMDKNEVEQGMEFLKDEVRQTINMLVYYFITKELSLIVLILEKLIAKKSSCLRN